MRYRLFHIFAIFSNGRGSNFGWSICEKIVIASWEDLCDTMLVWIHSEVLRNCQFHVFTTFSNSRRPFRIAQSHKFETTPFADNSDWMWLNSVQHFMRYWHLGKIGHVNRSLWPNSSTDFVHFDNSKNQGATNAVYKIAVKYIKWF